MSETEIQRRIPHRGAMLLIDRIVEQGEGEIKTEKTFHADEPFFDGHFPNRPIVPGVIQCECCLQSGALLLAGEAGDAMAGKLPVATRMDNVKFKKMVAPGDTVQISVTLKETVSNAYYMTGKMTLGGKLCARLDFTCSLVDAPA
ncbi:MAG: 3-hydroxyacyl-ACP dehydratase FabZ family protein [Planctomycetota bacterium]